MNSFLSWVVEVYNRFGLKSPKFFQTLQLIGLIALGVGFIPDALKWLDLTPTLIVDKVIAVAVKVAGGITWVISKLPVTSTVSPVEDGKTVNGYRVLPFTTDHRA